MARTYAIPTLLDDDGLPIVNAWCRAIRLDTQAFVEEQYTDKDGDATFTTLPDAVDCVIVCTWIDETGKEHTRRILSEAHPTMDEVRQGANYRKIHVGDLTADHIHLGSAQGNSDDISDEGASHKWDTGVPPTILDQLANGAYGKVLAEDIDITSHHVKLSATLESTNANYVTNNEKTGAGDGYDFFETKLTAYGLSIKSSVSSTRIELTATHIAGYSAGVLQFEVKASDGKGYFGAGTIVCDATGFHLNHASTKYIELKETDLADAKIDLVTPGGGIRISCVDGIYLPTNIKTNLYPATDMGCDLGESSTPKRWGYGIFYRLGDTTKPIERIYVNEIRGYGTSFCGDESYPFKKVAGEQVLLKEVAASPGDIPLNAQLYTKSTNKVYCITGDGVEHEMAFA